MSSLVEGYEKNQNHNISVGPWGGQDGAWWDDGIYCGVRQVVISHGAAIDSIQVEYDERGCSIWSDRHGGTGGCKTDKIKLDFPKEFLVSISGYYGHLTQLGPIVVRSLSFDSNMKKYGPFGTQDGTQFSFPIICGKIIGFNGRCSSHLDSIGVYLKPLNPPKALSPSPNIVAEKFGYTTVAQETTVHKTYEMVFAVREKDDQYHKLLSNSNLQQLTHTNQLPTECHGELNHKVSIPHCTDKESSDVIRPVKYGPWGEKDDQYHKLMSNSHLQQQTHTYQLPTECHGELNHKVSIPHCTDKESSDVIWPVKYGPWGGDGGVTFDDGVFTGVREVHIMRNGGIVSIKICYDRNGQPIWGNRHGGKAGLRLDKVAFDYPSEILTHISGYYGSSIFMGPTVVRSLTFHTTKRKYGPFGEEQGISFSSGSKQGMIVGFHGRKGWLLDTIGVHVLEGNFSIPRLPTIDAFNMNDLKTEVIGYDQMVKGTNPGGLGPWGGDGGKPWDDGAFSGVKQIYLIKRDAICAIEIEYDRNGQSIWSTRHGGGGGCGYSTHKMKFEYPHEVLTGISGYYGPIPVDACTKAIRSLTFFTNRAKYGPFGEEIGTFFGSTTEGKVVGFHGRSGSYLDAIGVHMQRTSGDGGRVKAMLNKIFN